MNDALRIIVPPQWDIRSVQRHLARLREHSDLLAVLSRHRIIVRYKQSMLGGLWAVLQPLSMMVVFTIVFSRLVKMPSEGVPYALFAFTGLLPWTFFSGAVSSGTGSLVAHAQLITKVYFPREILPLSYVVAGLVDLLIGSGVLLGLILFYRVGVTAEVVVALGVVGVLACFAFACSLILSATQVRIRDVGVALPIALQLMMFGSPVLYPLSAVPPAWRPFYILNPLAGLIDAFRNAVLGHPIDMPALSTAVLIVAVFLPLAYLVFKHAEVGVADIV